MRCHIDDPLASEPWTDDTTPADRWPAGAIPQEWVCRLFLRMQALYGTRFLYQWREVDPDAMRRRWGIELGKLTHAQIQRGMALLVTQDVPPNLPQFVGLCKPGLDPYAAYLEAIAGIAAREQGDIGRWSETAIYWAAISIGAFDLKSQSYQRIRRRWEAALAAERACPHEVPVPLPSLKPPDAAKARSEACLVEPAPHINTAELVNSIDLVIDHKRWARRIHQRIMRGDGSVTRYQAHAAMKALR